jgi:alpha-tubulin suppressor-like RCC1 family protein
MSAAIDTDNNLYMWGMLTEKQVSYSEVRDSTASTASKQKMLCIKTPEVVPKLKV